ncbi:MAG: hypothetical protein ACRCWU_02285 [Metamycoplasmataceae bacterium]
MKKLLFRLGVLSLVIIPIGVLTSCSSSIDTKPTINTEAGKFIDTTTNLTTPTSTEAAKTITNATTPEAKKIALKTFIVFPNLDKEFDFDVKKAWPNPIPTKDGVIVVTVSVYAKSDTTTKLDTDFEISGFANSTDLEKASLKFAIPIDAVISITSKEATKRITDATTPEAKKIALEEIVSSTKIPTTLGYTFEVNEASFKVETATQIEVQITVTETSSSKMQDVTFVVKSLYSESSAIDDLEREINKLINKNSIEGEILTAQEAMTIIKDNDTLDLFYARVDLKKGYSYDWESNELQESNLLYVEVLVKSPIIGIASKSHTITITFSQDN